MYCSRCGAEVEEGARYCPSCGNEIPQSGDDSRPGEGKVSGESEFLLRRLLGQDRRAKVVTLGTVLAIAIAVIALIALDPGDEEDTAVPQDALTRQLDRACVRHKAEIAAAQRRALVGGGPDAGAIYAESFVPIVGDWRSDLDRAAIPVDRVDRVEDLKSALLEVQIDAGTFARVLREGKRGEIATAAGDLETATENVEAAVGALELRRCSRLRISQGRLVRQ